MSDGPVDGKALEMLRRVGGTKLVKRLVGMLLVTAPERILKARSGYAAGDLDAVERATHSLKSSCGQLGAVSLQALCGQMEQAAAARQPESLPELLDELEAEFARVKPWFERAAEEEA